MERTLKQEIIVRLIEVVAVMAVAVVGIIDFGLIWEEILEDCDFTEILMLVGMNVVMVFCSRIIRNINK